MEDELYNLIMPISIAFALVSPFWHISSTLDKKIKLLEEEKLRLKNTRLKNTDEIAKKIENLLNLRFCSSFELEYVDESKTSLKIKNFNQRGKRDMLSARYISQRDGYRHSILPLSITG